LAYLEDDNLVQGLATNKKKNDDSLDEDDQVKDTKTKFVHKVVKIEDIRADEIIENADANNASILAGSEAEDQDDEEYGDVSLKEQSTFKSLLKSPEKTRSVS
jgi:hypothetical protein